MIAALIATPFAAYRWETPAVTTETLDRPFEFVCVASPGLTPHADRAPFATHFTAARAGADVVAFRNLGGDAVLVVPCPRSDDRVYAHLGSFMRDAAGAQHHALWREVGVQMGARVGDRPVWLSTAGAGVAWLHLRLDDRPKYYSHRAYAAG